MLIVVVLLVELAKLGHKLNAKYGFDQKKQNIIKYKKFLSHTKMVKEVLMFGDTEIERDKFYHYKRPIF